MASEKRFISENMRRVLLKEHIKKEIKRAGFGGIKIQRTPMGTRVTLIAERPGMVIGRSGASIKNLTETIEKKFTFDNPQIEVQEVKNPNINVHIMAKKLADALERGWKFRRAGHSTVQKIMGAGAKGCQVTIAGKLTGERHRTAKFTAGHIKHCGEPANLWMETGYAQALTKMGVIGVKIQIMKPDAKLPDEIKITILGEKKEEEEVKKEAKKEEAEKKKEEGEKKEEVKKEDKKEEAEKKKEIRAIEKLKKKFKGKQFPEVKT